MYFHYPSSEMLQIWKGELNSMLINYLTKSWQLMISYLKQRKRLNVTQKRNVKLHLKQINLSIILTMPIKKPLQINDYKGFAEEEGFEPPVPVKAR